MISKLTGIATAFAFLAAAGLAPAKAGSLQDRIDAGKSIRIGFAIEEPWAYLDGNGKPVGLLNAYATDVLESMGHANIEPVATEWRDLIPGLNAGHFDMVTGGMYMLGERCEIVAFSDPLAKVGDIFIVPAGNPMNLHTLDDVVAAGAAVATGKGYRIAGQAREAGAAKVIEVALPEDILAAVEDGRADAGAVTYLTGARLVAAAGGAVELSDASRQPAEGVNWVGIAFRKEDSGFRDAFNAAQAPYLGSDEMLSSLAPYGYGPGALPDGKTAEWVCANR